VDESPGGDGGEERECGNPWPAARPDEWRAVPPQTDTHRVAISNARIERLHGIDQCGCPRCHTGRIKPVQILPALRCHDPPPS
jgi:hypothetical protein